MCRNWHDSIISYITRLYYILDACAIWCAQISNDLIQCTLLFCWLSSNKGPQSEQSWKKTKCSIAKENGHSIQVAISRKGHTFANKRGWNWYFSSPGISITTLSWKIGKRNHFICESHEYLEKNKRSWTHGRAYYLFTKVDRHIFSRYALRKNGQNNLCWRIVVVMPTPQPSIQLISNQELLMECFAAINI